MPTEFYFEVRYFIFLTEKLQSHSFTDTETLNSDKSDLNQSYSESELAFSNCPLFPFNSCSNIFHNPNVLQFNHETSPKNSVHVGLISLNDVTATMGKTPLCKI